MKAACTVNVRVRFMLYLVLELGVSYCCVTGWHLPGFDDRKWATGKPTDGISHAGVSFYR